MINATPQTIRAVGEAMQLAALLDDRLGHTDDARVAAWAEQIQRHQLERDDLLNGIQAFYDSPSERAIQVGDLIHHARQVRRDRNEREAETERERRAALCDTKAADEVHAIAAGAVMGRVANKTERLIRAENQLQTCTNKAEAIDAIREYFAAKREAREGPRPRRDLQLDRAALRVDCPWDPCRARAGSPCTSQGNPMAPHPSRIEAGQEVKANA